jgi:hypothetical protein
VRSLLHDAKVYQAYEREAERLREDGAVIHRVMLDTELKREYQQFLQGHNRGKSDSDGRPDRSPVGVVYVHESHVGNALVAQAIADGKRTGALSTAVSGRLRRDLLGTKRVTRSTTVQ